MGSIAGAGADGGGPAAGGGTGTGIDAGGESAADGTDGAGSPEGGGTIPPFTTLSASFPELASEGSRLVNELVAGCCGRDTVLATWQ